MQQNGLPLLLVFAMFAIKYASSTTKMDGHEHFKWALEQPKIRRYREFWNAAKTLAKPTNTLNQMHRLRFMPCRDYRHFESVEAAVLEYRKIWENTLELANMISDQATLLGYQRMFFNGETVKHLFPPIIFQGSKVTENARQGRTRLVFKGEFLVEMTVRHSSKQRVFAESDCIILDSKFELGKFHPPSQALMLFLPINRHCSCGKFTEHVEQEPVQYDLFALERIRFLNKGLSKVTDKAAIKELIAMAKAHPDMYRVYRDFYPYSYVEPFYNPFPCFVGEWNIEEGQCITMKGHAYSLLTQDLFGRLVESPIVLEPGSIVIESNNYSGKEIESLTLLGQFLALDKTRSAKRAPIESYVFREMVNSTRVFPLIVTMTTMMSLEKVTIFLKRHSSNVMTSPVKIPKDANLVGVFPRQVEAGDIIYWRDDGSVQRVEHVGAIVKSSPFGASLFHF